MSALQQSGAISLTEIANEFGVSSGARNLKDFYRGGSNVSDTDLVTSSATNAPSDNTPVSNFASVTGLTCTRTSTTSTSVGSYVKVGSTQTNTSGTILSLPGASNAAGNPTRLARVRNESVGAQPVIERLETQYGAAPSVSTDEPNNVNIASGSVSSAYDVVQNAVRYFKVRFHGAGGASDQKASVEMQSVVTTTTIAYSFTNNSAYAVNVVGGATNTIQVGDTLTGLSPDGSDQFVITYTPASTDQTATPAPPTNDSAVSDFGGATGLTCTRTTGSTTTTNYQSWAVNSEQTRTFTVGGTISNLTSNSSTTRLNGVRIDEGGVSQLVASNTSTVTIQNIQSNNRNSGNIFFTVTSAVYTYNFTNNTGFPVTISGSGVTTTTIPDGGTNNQAIAHPSGNFTIQYQVANAQALNGNIPSSGAISLTNFYGTEDFS